MNAIRSAIKYGGGIWVAIGVLILAAFALFGCGGEYSIHKSVTMPPNQVGLIQMPESKASVKIIERVPDGEPVYTVSSQIPSKDGKHRIRDEEVILYREVLPTPIPDPFSPMPAPTSDGWSLQWDPVAQEFKHVSPAP